jgi:tetratricopeptide (TPR) repeat protein
MNTAPVLTFPACLSLLVGMTSLLPAQPLPSNRQPAPAAANPRAALPDANAPSQLYLQGHLVMKDGTEKEGKGDFAGAYFKFKDARDLFDAAGEADRTWQPEIVEYRRRKIREDMERVRQLEIKRRAEGGAPSPSGIVGSASEKPLTIEPAKPAGSGPVRNTTVVMEERVRGMQAQIDALTKKNEEIFQKLGKREEELRSERKAVFEAKAAENALRKDLADAQTKIDTAAPEAKRKNEALTKRVADLEKQLNDSMTQLSAANGKTDLLLEELEKAYGQVKEITRERDEIKKERDQMVALLSGEGGKAPEKLKIIAENQRLKKELEAAQASIAKLTSEKDADQKEIASLKVQVSTMQEQITRFQQESEDYRQQIASLTGRLDETNKRLGEMGAGAVSDVEASLENKVLREIILQQMKQQAKREAARRNVMDDLLKEGVLDSMKGLGVETERILRNLNEMAANSQMTREQRAVLSNSNLDQFLLQNGVGNMMMAQDSQELKDGATPPASESPTGETRTKDELSPELKAYANAAEEFFTQQSYEDAANQYRKILMIEPMNVHALSNLGVVQVNQANYEEAEKTIKKALAYFYDNAPAHYLLGIIYMRQGRLDDAAEEIDASIKLNPQDPANSNSWLTLGLIAGQKKKMADAERYFKEAILLDPANAYAHFNLAVLYNNDNKTSLARQHYRKAIENGASRDNTLEGMIGS